MSIAIRWYETAFTKLLGIQYPIVQGAFGGGLSSVALVAEVSNAGGLGSYGFQGMKPEQIITTIEEIRCVTDRPFAANLWVSTEDAFAENISEREFADALAPLLNFFQELKLEPPNQLHSNWPSFEEQARVILELKPPVFSFLFGIPSRELLAECRSRSIFTVGTATTVEEAVELERAGVDCIVATGSDAGGHRASFIKSAEASLTGTFSLVPQVVDRVSVPVIAAGGIADGRGVSAALSLGASGVQIGTAFLACKESNATAQHKDRLLFGEDRLTVLTRGYSGRLARGYRNTLLERLESSGTPNLPYPLQNQIVSSLRSRAIETGRTDLISTWAGQATGLLKHQSANELFKSLVEQTEKVISKLGQ